MILEEYNKLKAIEDSSPSDDWTHYCTRNRQYFKRDGYRLMVWLSGTGVWSVPVTDTMRFLERRVRIEQLVELYEQVEQLESNFNSIDSQNQKLAWENAKLAQK